jgi:hypothetical protein
MLITLRRDIERWTGIAISLVSAFMLYRALRPLFVVDHFGSGEGLMFLQPAVMLIGGAAIWRMGSLLRAPSAPQLPLPGERPPAHPAPGTQRSNASDQTPPADHFNARLFVSPGVAVYFGILFTLTFIASVPGAITIGMLLFIVPGQILIASSTLLYYSFAVLPAYFIDRLLGKRLLAAAVAAISLAAAALLPHYINGYLLGRLVASDHSDPSASFKPRSFELPHQEADNYWTNWRRPESHRTTPAAPCADLCQQLLFRGNVDQVVIRDHSELGAMVVTKIGTTDNVLFKPRWRRFRLQRRGACPDTLSLIADEFVHEVVGGRCLVEDVIDSPDADVVLSISKSPVVRADQDRRQGSTGPSFELSRIETGPTTVTIAERRDGRAIPVEVKTTLVAHYATVPFYFSTTRCGGAEIPALCLSVVTDPFPSSLADPFEMIARRYRLPIAPAPKSARLSVIPVSDDDRTAVNAILKQDYGADGYIPITQTRLVASFVNARLKSGQLNQDDIELIRALLKQRAFAAPIESKLPPATYQALKPLLPDMFERIAYRADGQTEMVQSLNVMLEQFFVEDTDPYSPALCQERKNGDLRVCYKREFRSSRKK